MARWQLTATIVEEGEGNLGTFSVRSLQEFAQYFLLFFGITTESASVLFRTPVAAGGPTAHSLHHLGFCLRKARIVEGNLRIPAM